MLQNITILHNHFECMADLKAYTFSKKSIIASPIEMIAYITTDCADMFK